jgi:hypothetical protein
MKGASYRERDHAFGQVMLTLRIATGLTQAGVAMHLGGSRKAVQLWDLENGEHLRTLRCDRPYERLDITGIRGVTEAQKATLRALGAMENAPVPGTG